jgi:hypothetical protein
LPNTYTINYRMPNILTPEQKAELLKRLEMARQAKQAKQAQKAPAKSKSAKKSNSTELSISNQAPQDPSPTQTVPDCPQKPAQDIIPSHPTPQASSVITSELEQPSSKMPTETSLPSQPQEIPSSTTGKHGKKKKVCLPVSSDTDSSDEEEKPKKRRGRKPYATIVLHKEPKKSIDKVIQRLSRIESSSSESDSDNPPEPKISEPIPIPQKKNTRPVAPQTKTPHNQDEQRREILRRLALEYYN